MTFSSLTASCKHILKPIWKVFLSGFFTVLPIALTLTILRVTISFTLEQLNPLGHFLTSIGFFKRIFGWLPHGELIIVILLLFAIGLVVRSFFVQWIINFLESLLNKIPLVKLIYSGTKQLVDTFSSTNKEKSPHQVVLVEFPQPGTYSLGFVTGPVAPIISAATESNMVNVFLPTTPNPTTGFYLVMPQNRVIPINITRQEAMVLIISGGIIQPKRDMTSTEKPVEQSLKN